MTFFKIKIQKFWNFKEKKKHSILDSETTWVFIQTYVSTNDITSATSLFEIILFADDTKLLYSHPDIATKIN